MARLFARGDEQREHEELERLDRTATALASADDSGRARQEVSWQTRFETLLESLNEFEREQVATELRTLVDEYTAAGSTGGVSGNTFQGPTAFQAGNHNKQENNFGSGA
ncbi:hypothetical protein ACFV80_43180 [Streptomyces sp. NPDC059862]|uniref:hypothetical protein n=1 Tax=Streptomyces sp. NPDC059862 TaxID=3346975 RepID=UPI003653929F